MPKGPAQGQQQQQQPTDINQLADVMHASGIDLAAEERIMNETWDRKPSKRKTAELWDSGAFNYDLLSKGNRFPLSESRNVDSPQDYGDLFFKKDALGSMTENDQLRELEDKREVAARRAADLQQYHLGNPFLFGNSMRRRMENIASNHQLKMPMNGLFDKIAPRLDSNAIEIAGQLSGQKTENIVMAKAPSILNRDAPLGSFLNVLSLATKERMATLLEDAYRHAYHRHSTSHAEVPPEWEGVAGRRDTTNDVNHSINAVLSRLTAAERKAEYHRIKKRAQRKQRHQREANNAKKMAAASGAQTPANGTPATGTEPAGGTMGMTAPEPPKLSKKEQDRQKKLDQANDEVQVRNANAAVGMALGGSKKYSWMLPGGAGAKKPGTPARSNVSNAAAGSAAANAAASPDTSNTAPSKIDKNGIINESFDRRFGVDDDQPSSGYRVYLRDFIHALEADGREGLALTSLHLRFKDSGHPFSLKPLGLTMPSGGKPNQQSSNQQSGEASKPANQKPSADDANAVAAERLNRVGDQNYMHSIERQVNGEPNPQAQPQTPQPHTPQTPQPQVTQQPTQMSQRPPSQQSQQSQQSVPQQNEPPRPMPRWDAPEQVSQQSAHGQRPYQPAQSQTQQPPPRQSQ